MVWVGELGRNAYVHMYVSYIHAYTPTHARTHPPTHTHTHPPTQANSNARADNGRTAIFGAAQVHTHT
jgi:hypothetical protein